MAFQLTAQVDFKANKKHHCLHFARHVARQSNQRELRIVYFFLLSFFELRSATIIKTDVCYMRTNGLVVVVFFRTDIVLELQIVNWFCLKMCVRRVPIGSKWEYVIQTMQWFENVEKMLRHV